MGGFAISIILLGTVIEKIGSEFGVEQAARGRPGSRAKRARQVRWWMASDAVPNWRPHRWQTGSVGRWGV